MADYGFRISIDGQDVKTCTDLNTVVNSKYSNFKGSLSGTGSINVDTINETVTVAHGLGYIPMARLLVSTSDSDLYTNTPYVDNTFDDSTFIKVRMDATNVYFNFYYENYLGDPRTFYYKYFIFIDKGKL